MIEIYKTVNNEIVLTDAFGDGVWVNLVNPDEDEISKVSSALNVEPDFLKAALDEEERARIESENGQTLIIVDTPVIEKEGSSHIYTTIPLGIILIKHIIITVCLREDTLLNDFSRNKVKAFLPSTKQDSYCRYSTGMRQNTCST